MTCQACSGLGVATAPIVGRLWLQALETLSLNHTRVRRAAAERLKLSLSNLQVLGLAQQTAG